MQTKTKKITAAVAAALLLLGVSTAAIAASDNGKGNRQTHMIEKISKELSLNAAQKTQLVAITEEVRAQRKQQRKLAKEKMRNLLVQENINKNDILQIMQIRKEGRAQVQEIVAEKFAAFHATLNKAQRQKIADFTPRIFAVSDGGRRGWHKRHRKHGWETNHDDDHDDNH